MLDVYIYVPKENAQDIIDCGMKLSEYGRRSIPVGGEEYSCICGFLHPMDFEGKDDDSVTCIRAEVPERYCFVCDGDLYELSKRDYGFAEKYEKSIVSVRDYKLGDYCNPECLVVCTLIGGTVFDINNGKHRSLLLYNSSEELYYDCLEAYLVDKCGISRKSILSSLFYRLKNEYAIRSTNTWDNDVVYYHEELNKTFSFKDEDCRAIVDMLIDGES